mmetsp:Transcript_55082/g.128910  ORF Transcript_55082/g.128910 Transcript_55082/m.128910 type:complete len:317 (-) Transcript_55082:25-975(-)
MQEESTPTIVHTALSSAIAGFIARIPCHPLDTVKARLQGFDGHRYKGLFNCVKLTLREEGVLGFYRGFGAVASFGPSAACLYFTSYEAIKQNLHTESTHLAPAVHLLAGLGAEAVACIIFVPVDVVKERLQVQHKMITDSTQVPAATRPANALPQYAGSWDALRIIARSEGPLALYAGYAATLASFGPFSALYFAFYEQARHLVGWMQGATEGSQKLPAWGTMLSSAAAGALAGVITSPIDLAKLRLQTQPRLRPGEVAPEGHLTGVMDALRRVFAESGTRGLFRGATARVAFHVPSTCISFTCFEECRKVVQKIV